MRIMSTLKELFGDRKPKCKRNFIQENIRQLHGMQNCLQNREDLNSANSAIGKRKINKLQTVPTSAFPDVTGLQTSSEQYAKIGMLGLPNKTFQDNTGSLGHVKQAGLKQKGHTRGRSPMKKGSQLNRSNMKGEKDDVITKGDMAEFVRRQRVVRSNETAGEVPPTEFRLNMSELSALDGEKSSRSMSTGSRSLGCQTVDPKNLDKLYNEGVIKYPSSRKPISMKGKQSEKKPPTREMGLQTDKMPSPPMEGNQTLFGKFDIAKKNMVTSSAAGDTQTTNDSDNPDIQKLTLSQLKESGSDMEDSPESRDVDYLKANAKCVTSHLKSPLRKLKDPRKAPPKYQKGVVPKYLRERQEEWQKEEEQRIRDTPDPACPPGHVVLPDSERRETVKMLKKSYAELVRELNMMPVRSDTLRMRQRKMELEQQLNKLEEGIRVFSRPKVFVKIGA